MKVKTRATKGGHRDPLRAKLADKSGEFSSEDFEENSTAIDTGMLPSPVWVVFSLLPSPYSLNGDITADFCAYNFDARSTREDISYTERGALNIHEIDTNNFGRAGGAPLNQVQQCLSLFKYLSVVASTIPGEIFFQNRSPSLGVWGKFELINTRAHFWKVNFDQCLE